VSGSRYVGPGELGAILALDDPVLRAGCFADACRINVLHMIAQAGSGHVGSSFSCLEVLSWLHLEVLGAEDRCFSSKGHDAPATYAVLAGLGRIAFDRIHGLRRLGGLPGHPDVTAVPEVVTNTGSLGMGVSKAQGLVRADRAAGRAGRVVVITGDGELQEGQFWESLGPAANAGLGEITVIVDANGLQSDTWVDQVSDLGDLETKARAFGWAAARCDGHDLHALDAALRGLDAAGPEVPKLLVAETRKGAGVGFMEPGDLPRSPLSLYAHHSGAPSPAQHAAAVAEIRSRLEARLGRPLALTDGPAVPARPAPRGASLIGAYAEALVEEAEREPRLVALSADLRRDCGLDPFAHRFPSRFFECGIAEQHMVSQAGAMALGGLLPVVHSFACFLTTRANEQIYNNASERTRVLYTGTLAGVVPAGPGHSHQSVRDVALLGSTPGLDLVEPATPAQLRAALRWAVADAPGSVYLRLVSLAWDVPDSDLSDAWAVGRGELARPGDDALVVATGPVLLGEAMRAAEQLDNEGLGCAVLSLPWLRDIDGAWLAGLAGDRPIVCLDNHLAVGGQGTAVREALAAVAPAAAARTLVHGITELPRCGTNDEALRAHRLDAPAVAAVVASFARGRASLAV
jgi:transketolase